MNVRVQGLLNGATWISETYGRERLAHVLRGCSPALRERYTSAKERDWHPAEEFVEFVSVADRLLGQGNGKICEAIGAAGARANSTGIVVRAAFYLTETSFFMRRVALLWSQYNDEGTMDVPYADPGRMVIRVQGVRHLPRPFCDVLTGWVRHMSEASGARDIVVRILEHVERGPEARCSWETRGRVDGA